MALAPPKKLRFYSPPFARAFQCALPRTGVERHLPLRGYRISHLDSLLEHNRAVIQRHQVSHPSHATQLRFWYLYQLLAFCILIPTSFISIWHPLIKLSSTRSLISSSSDATHHDTANTMDNGKAPAQNGFRNGVPGGANGGVINVQPPRREDLQPAYAQTLQGESEDAGSHGWYGSMSTCSLYLPGTDVH